MSTHSQPAQMPMSYEPQDICVKRHGGNENSVAANPDAAVKSRMSLKLLKMLCAGRMCIHDFSEALGLGANHFSGRLTGLHPKYVRKAGKCEHKPSAAMCELTDEGKIEARRAVVIG